MRELLAQLPASPLRSLSMEISPTPLLLSPVMLSPDYRCGVGSGGGYLSPDVGPSPLGGSGGPPGPSGPSGPSGPPGSSGNNGGLPPKKRRRRGRRRRYRPYGPNVS